MIHRSIAQTQQFMGVLTAVGEHGDSHTGSDLKGMTPDLYPARDLLPQFLSNIPRLIQGLYCLRAQTGEHHDKFIPTQSGNGILATHNSLQTPADLL